MILKEKNSHSVIERKSYLNLKVLGDRWDPEEPEEAAPPPPPPPTNITMTATYMDNYGNGMIEFDQDIVAHNLQNRTDDVIKYYVVDGDR